MIVASEAVLPLGITAVVATGGDHTTKHAHWGYYMITAVAAQIFTGWIRTKGLEAKHANFSFLHRVRGLGSESGLGRGLGLVVGVEVEIVVGVVSGVGAWIWT